MNEAEWRRSDLELAAWNKEEEELEKLLNCAQRRHGGKRKRRLFANACCRRFHHIVPIERLRNVVSYSDLFADEIPSATESLLEYECDCAEADWKYNSRQMRESERYVIAAIDGLRPKIRFREVSRNIMTAAIYQGIESQSESIRYYDYGITDPEDCLLVHISTMEENRTQRRNLIDIFGNSKRARIVDERWLTSNVMDLATAIYEDRVFDRMPILADNLLDAGCDSDEIIQHCRGNGPHVRGCWVVDLLLGKE